MPFLRASNDGKVDDTNFLRTKDEGEMQLILNLVDSIFLYPNREHIQVATTWLVVCNNVISAKCHLTAYESITASCNAHTSCNIYRTFIFLESFETP